MEAWGGHLQITETADKGSTDPRVCWYSTLVHRRRILKLTVAHLQSIVSKQRCVGYHLTRPLSLEKSKSSTVVLKPVDLEPLIYASLG